MLKRAHAGIRMFVLLAVCLVSVICIFQRVFSWDDSRELKDVSGAKLQASLRDWWPNQFSSSDVTHAFILENGAIDSFSTFIRFETRRDAALKWIDFLRSSNTTTASELDKLGDRQCETRESIPDQIPLNEFTGEVPEWWKPSGEVLGAFETMVWYGETNSGVGRGNYIQFDANTNQCWVYSYTSQHDLLWQRGKQDVQDAAR